MINYFEYTEIGIIPFSSIAPFVIPQEIMENREKKVPEKRELRSLFFLKREIIIVNSMVLSSIETYPPLVFGKILDKTSLKPLQGGPSRLQCDYGVGLSCFSGLSG